MMFDSSNNQVWSVRIVPKVKDLEFNIHEIIK